MIQKWRLLVQGASSAAENMATDEAILRHVTANESPCTLRFYTWNPSAVSIGYFQGIEQEVNLDVCREHHVAVVRRLTGGGAVYHDRDGEVTYSISIKASYPGIPAKVLDSYQVLCAGLLKGFAYLGLAAEFKPINDIVVNGKKISGNAQTRRYGGILQHGTLLCKVDPRLMFALLKVPDEKIRDKLIQTVEERVTSVERELGNVDRDIVIKAMIKGFTDALAVELISGQLSTSEMALAAQIKAERYANQSWNFKR
jgi:lipoate-protein ligase A